jgi:nifR3 family TIM-barrel protein
MPDLLLSRLRSPKDRPVLAAPLAGWTDAPFRKVLRLCGAKHIWIPFVSSHALTSGPAERDPFLPEIREERCHVQIFGSDPARNAEAARIVEDAGALSIDFNCGCSVKKVHKGGGGSALLKDIDLLARNLEAIVKAVSIPVSLKTRVGFNKENDYSGVDACRHAAALGCSWVTLHGRTAKQGFDGPADWSFIGQLAQDLPIPVVGNGDISTPADAERMFTETGCAGVMIGRAMMGDPWIVADTENYLSSLIPRPHRTRKEIVEVMLLHQQALLDFCGPRKGVLDFRKHMVRYLRGFAQASQLRRMLVLLGDAEEVRHVLEEFGEGRPPAGIA